ITVMATPASAAISNVTVGLTNAIAGQASNYTIKFKMQQPLDFLVITEGIDITFPAGTDVSTWTAVTVEGTTWAGAPAVYTFPANLMVWNIFAAGAALPPNGIHIDLLTGDLAPGWVTVRIAGVTNGAPCHQTLIVGTSKETAVTSPSYPIYLFDIQLLPGWNLISLPGIPEDTDIEVVLADLLPPVCDPGHDFQVWYYDCGQWYVYCYDTAFETLTTMDECRAYWIYIDYPASFRVKGVWYNDPPDPPYQKKCYHECWNMVGFTSANASKTLATYTASLVPAGKIIYWYGWDAASQTWEINPDPLLQGKGYWMAFTADACFVPPL
ncbi:MAG: hypothetical protein ACETWG_03845, partial [Candidatus Neomarinimicrobiota bacterium]